MAIFLDDSGWGSLLGGVMIGMYNYDNDKYISYLIPVKYFQGSLFATGKYRQQALKLVIMHLDKIYDIEQPQKMMICRGTCLDTVYDFFYNAPAWKGLVSRGEIKEPLQGLLEESFAKSLKRYGVPQRSDGAHCLSFDDQLKWIREDKSREKYVKTGWRSWQVKYSKSLK